ncbi:MAG: methyltransferase family protein [Candidatus Acidiferrales bacterium]
MTTPGNPIPPAPTRASQFYGYLQTLILCVFAAAVFLAPGRPFFSSGKLVHLIGTALCAIGLVLLFAALRTIGRSIQIAPQPRPDATLVTSGIYRWFRHPIYTAIVLVVAGLFLRKPTLPIGIAAALVIAFLAVKVRLEEKLLAVRYPTYAEYKSRSWGLLPWPRLRS